MGTRSLTVFLNEKGKEICVLYKQFDGYPQGWGNSLKEDFKNCYIGNGIPLDRKSKSGREVVNGIEELPIRILKKVDDGKGGFYMFPPNTRDTGEEYIYYLSKGESFNDKSAPGDYMIQMKIEEVGGGIIYDGPLHLFVRGQLR